LETILGGFFLKKRATLSQQDVSGFGFRFRGRSGFVSGVKKTSVSPSTAVREEESIGVLTTSVVSGSSSTFGLQQKHIQSQMTQTDKIT
jgi:hypothetical protein